MLNNIGGRAVTRIVTAASHMQLTTAWRCFKLQGTARHAARGSQPSAGHGRVPAPAGRIPKPITSQPQVRTHIEPPARYAPSAARQRPAEGFWGAAAEMADSGLDCPICIDPMDPPVALPCGHSGCKGCLLTWWASTPNCPVCRKPASLEAVKQLPVSFLLQAIIEPRLAAHNQGTISGRNAKLPSSRRRLRKRGAERRRRHAGAPSRRKRQPSGSKRKSEPRSTRGS